MDEITALIYHPRLLITSWRRRVVRHTSRDKHSAKSWNVL